MKKVLFTATVDSHILHFHIPYLKYFKEHGYEVHVATNGNEEIPYCDKKIVIPFERSPFKLNNLKAIRLLKKVIMEEKYDIIHTHTPMGSVVTRLAAIKARRKYHTRVIYTAHGFHFYKGAPIKNWLMYYPVEKMLSRVTDTLITINNEDYELAKKKFHCKDVQYVPGVGIDENKFNIKMTKKEKHELRESLGLKDDDFVMIFVARLDKNKNQGFLIDATRELIKTKPNIHLLLVGPDEYNGQYQKQAADIKDHVHFTGMRKDVALLLSISDVAVSSSIREGLPVNIMEAMIVGLPVVATNARGVRDLVSDERNGYIVNRDNLSGFINCINTIYSDKEKCCNISNNNLLDSKKYSSSVLVELMNKIYNKRKKILHVLSSSSYSGAENVVINIIKLLSDDYDMAYCSLNGSISDVLKTNNIKYYGLEIFNKNNLNRIIDEYNPDIIHAHDYSASFVTALSKFKGKIISHLHNNCPFATHYTPKSIAYSLCINRFYRVIGVSDAVYNEAVFKKRIASKYCTLYNYVDSESIYNKSNEYSVNDRYDLFFIGRLATQKNPLMFIQIVYEIKKKNPNIKACMIGDGNLKDKCVDLIHEYNLDNNIHMYGFLSNPFPIIKNSEIGVMPSLWEGFGLTAVEAIALGKRVYNSGAGGLSEIFKNNEFFICSSIEEYVDKILHGEGEYHTNKFVKDILDKDRYISLLKKIYK